ncbi:MAG: competence/damage-inducible protein A [Planctomycetota bacterium]|jgi:nicotinamide-nucleotide amidase
MMKASIVSIGNELLSGQTLDTDTKYLCERLFSIGVPVVSSYTVGDDVDLIVRKLALASEEGEIVLVTGGLGPTDDDVTRQAFSKFLGAELEVQEELLESVREYFRKRDLQLPEKTKVQACIPSGTRALVNSLGTAPGIRAEWNGRLLFAMPGVPSEMKQMFEELVFDELKKLAGGQFLFVQKLKCFGSGESHIAELLGSEIMKRGRNPLVNCTAHKGVVTLHIIATADTESRATEMVSKDENSIRKSLGELVYGSGEESLAEVVGQKLIEQNKTIAVAESCTGGLLAKLLTDVAGASEYFTYGWVTYSNSAKMSELGVASDLIEKYGAVSGEVAEAMANRARKKSGADFTVGITGIAGPAGGSEQKPVGLVYICVQSDKDCETKRFVFSHNRSFVRLQASQTALNMVRLRF